MEEGRKSRTVVSDRKEMLLVGVQQCGETGYLSCRDRGEGEGKNTDYSCASFSQV